MSGQIAKYHVMNVRTENLSLYEIGADIFHYMKGREILEIRRDAKDVYGNPLPDYAAIYSKTELPVEDINLFLEIVDKIYLEEVYGIEVV